MLKLVAWLLNNPGSENEPEPWATRFIAHGGMGVLFFVLFMGLSGAAVGLSVFLAALAYGTLVEGLEWAMAAGRRSRSLFFDCVLDWAGVTLIALVMASAWNQDLGSMIGSTIAFLLILFAGVIKRS